MATDSLPRTTLNGITCKTIHLLSVSRTQFPYMYIKMISRSQGHRNETQYKYSRRNQSQGHYANYLTTTINWRGGETRDPRGTGQGRVLLWPSINYTLLHKNLHSSHFDKFPSQRGGSELFKHLQGATRGNGYIGEDVTDASVKSAKELMGLD